MTERYTDVVEELTDAPIEEVITFRDSLRGLLEGNRSYLITLVNYFTYETNYDLIQGFKSLLECLDRYLEEKGV